MQITKRQFHNARQFDNTTPNPVIKQVEYEPATVTVEPRQ